MHVTMICCPFKTSYGTYAASLIAALERKIGGKVQWLASNCGCGDPIEVSRTFQATECDYFEMRYIPDFQSRHAWKRSLRAKARNLSAYFRAKRYADRSKTAAIVHFQQILNAYGSGVVFEWLQRPSRAARVITIHELDPHQLRSPETNTIYNKADGIIVHCGELKEKLIALNVSANKIHTVLHGVDMPTVIPDAPREGVIFYGGHDLMKGKGMATLFRAMSYVKQRLGAGAPTLRIHGHYGDTAPEAAKRLAIEAGVADNTTWLNQLSIADIARQYQTALLCVLPFTGSFAGLPASIAAANALPVVGTRRAGLPDHLGECAVWIDEENPQQLAQRIIDLLGNEPLWRELSRNVRARAEGALRWEVIADRTLGVYEQALRNKQMVAPTSHARRRNGPAEMVRR
jgi:glycosyltransferase involved in cell wall biosynthesis